MSFKTIAYSVLGWFANLGGDRIKGYRTYFSIAISLILKVLVGWHVMGAGSMDADHVSRTTDAVLIVCSGLSDLLGVFFHASTATAGPLAPLAAQAQAAEDTKAFLRRK